MYKMQEKGDTRAHTIVKRTRRNNENKDKMENGANPVCK